MVDFLLNDAHVLQLNFVVAVCNLFARPATSKPAFFCKNHETVHSRIQRAA